MLPFLTVDFFDLEEGWWGLDKQVRNILWKRICIGVPEVIAAQVVLVLHLVHY